MRKLLIPVAMVCLSTFLAVAVVFAQDQTPPGCDLPQALENPIVFTRAPIDLRRTGGYFENFSPLQRFSEVASLTSGFGESDVVTMDRTGAAKVIYNCTASPVNCAAQEAKVSPSGKQIAFSVTTGTLLTELGVTLLRAPIAAKIIIHDIATGLNREVPNQPATGIARSPDWIDDSTLVFSANWQGVYPARPTLNCHQGVYPIDHPAAGKKRGYNAGACVSVDFPGPDKKALHLWRMKIDGTAQKNLTPSEQNAIRPVVLHNPKNKGRIVYSSFQDQEDRCYYQGAGGGGTCLNRWWLMSIAPDGTSPTSFMGAHHSPTLTKGTWGSEEFMVLRAAGEIATGEVCTGNYYRGNHVAGKSSVLCASPPLGDFQVEGCSTPACVKGNVLGGSKSTAKGQAQFIPDTLRYAVSFSVGSDNNQHMDSKGRTMGGMNYLSTMANGHSMATWWQGWCYNQEFSPNNASAPFKGTIASSGGQPLCDLQIVELLVPEVTDPHDRTQVKLLVANPLMHDFDASEIVARPVTHVQPPLDESKGCFLEVADLRATDLAPLSSTFDWRMRAENVGIQANTVKPQDPAFHRDNVRGLSIYEVKLHSTYYPAAKWQAAVNYTGWESVKYLGTQPMMPDGSLKMQVPCETPFYMSATDAAGKWITHDPWLHSLQKGETKTCFGCHEGHSVERRLELGKEPQAVFAGKQAAATMPSLTVPPVPVTFANVAPILTKACAGCHTGFENDALLWSRVFADQEQLDFPWMTKMLSANGADAFAQNPATCVSAPWVCYTLPRPYWTGLAGRYTRQSMLVWVLEGLRSDGYTNTDSATDQDFPANHPPVPVTPAEVKTVVDFIQTGGAR